MANRRPEADQARSAEPAASGMKTDLIVVVCRERMDLCKTEKLSQRGTTILVLETSITTSR